MKRLNIKEKKEFSQKLKHKAKEYGFKFASDTFYYKKGKYLITCDYVFPDERAVIYEIEIKPLAYDDIYWSVLGFDMSKKRRLSTRANGVASPKVILKSSKLVISENFDEVIKNIISQIEVEANKFIDNYCFDEYVINYTDSKENKYKSYYNPILKCLAYLNLGKLDEAKRIAKDQDSYKMIKETWGGKTFFDLVLEIEKDIYLIKIKI